MGGVIGIGVSGFFLALSLGFIRPDEPLPMPLRIFIFVIAAITLLASLANLRFRIKRRIALGNGRERNGIATLRGKMDEDGGSAFLVFKIAYDEWLLMPSTDDLKAIAGDLRGGVKACATLGEDEKIYALRIEGKPVRLQTTGSPFKGRMRAMVETAEKRFAEMERKRAG